MNYSVLMSIYKKENPNYFRQSIESMLNQIAEPEEIVIVKDGPLTDALDRIISEYADKYSSKITVVQLETNVGLGLALNEGLKVCRNELVARMDTDDISVPTRCEKQLKCFANDPNLDIVGTMVDEFYDDPNRPISSRIVPTQHKQICEFAKRRSPFNHPTVMYKKSKVLACGGYSDLRRNQDVDLFARMLFNGCKAMNINESLLLFRSSDDLLKRRRNWENTKSYISTIRRLWKMGFSSYRDYLIVSIAQLIIFCCPINLQNWLYKTFLRK
ncbi:MAG: glycosyltransferase [Syntrophomonadaceae bacterium]|nr:glycosyltransferase [Syntrophomonadaceae bacterium]